MRTRIAVWTLAGACVACGWSVYAFATAPDVEVPLGLTERVVQAIAYISCPFVALGARFYWLILLNAATYAVVGLVIESLHRHRAKPRHVNVQLSRTRRHR